MMITRKDNGKTEIIRENWQEYFKVTISRYVLRESYQGEMLPKFFLPVVRNEITQGYTCYILPLAPLALAMHVTADVLHIIWRDLLFTAIAIKEWRNAKSL